MKTEAGVSIEDSGAIRRCLRRLDRPATVMAVLADETVPSWLRPRGATRSPLGLPSKRVGERPGPAPEVPSIARQLRHDSRAYCIDSFLGVPRIRNRFPGARKRPSPPPELPYWSHLFAEIRTPAIVGVRKKTHPDRHAEGCPSIRRQRPPNGPRASVLERRPATRSPGWGRLRSSMAVWAEPSWNKDSGISSGRFCVDRSWARPSSASRNLILGSGHGLRMGAETDLRSGETRPSRHGRAARRADTPDVAVAGDPHSGLARGPQASWKDCPVGWRCTSTAWSRPRLDRRPHPLRRPSTSGTPTPPLPARTELRASSWGTRFRDRPHSTRAPGLWSGPSKTSRALSIDALNAGIDWCSESFPPTEEIERRPKRLNAGAFIGHSSTLIRRWFLRNDSARPD